MEYLGLLLSGVIIVLLIACIYLVTRLSKEKPNQETERQIKQLINEEFRNSRNELSEHLRINREELNNSIFQFQNNFLNALKQSGESQNNWANNLNKHLDSKLNVMLERNENSSFSNREEQRKTLINFQNSFKENINEINELQRQKFEDMARGQQYLIEATEQKLEKMRETVDEKLHKTLEERLGQSFRIVNEQLLAVQKGLGEMQNLAEGVGDLKKVLTNVKTRGVLGEVQLGNILEQIMAPDQYEANVKTVQHSNDIVEYAIKLPGKNNFEDYVYLPIDAKFPQEDFYRLQEAFDQGDTAGIESARKSLITAIKRFAKDISTKYLDPPYTTDFGIMFLPTEGLYAEIVKQPGIIEFLQREHKIIITGPTTLAAILNSLQMGFKTLAIQQRSGEVWEILGAVKTEFGKFGNVLAKAQKKINEANNELDKLVTTRTNVIQRKLREVEELPSENSVSLLDNN
ncbi:MAG: DNA recombination protein RmuC [Bacteroidales bacterium]